MGAVVAVVLPRASFGARAFLSAGSAARVDRALWLIADSG